MTEQLEESNADAEFQKIMEEGKGTEDTTATPTETKVKIGDAEYDPAELATLIESGKRASELEKGAREKFDKAAERQKELDAREAELSDMRLVFDAYRNGTSDEKKLIVQNLAKDAGISLSEAKETMENIDLSDPTDNETKLFRQLQTVLAQNAQLASKLQHFEGQLKTALVPLEDIRQYVSSEKEAKQVQSDIAAIKEKTGHDIGPEQIKIWRDNGISDPVKAIDVLLPMLKDATKNGAELARKQSEAPDGSQANTFDPNDPDLDADDIFRRVNKGWIPTS